MQFITEIKVYSIYISHRKKFSLVSLSLKLQKFLSFIYDLKYILPQ